MKRSLFSLLGVKTGGGGKRESFMDILSRWKDKGGAASQQAHEKVSASGWSARGCRRSEKQSTSLQQATPSTSYHCILVYFHFCGRWMGASAFTMDLNHWHLCCHQAQLFFITGLELEESFLIWPFALTYRLLSFSPC